MFQNEKWRPVDDATENSVNLCTGAEEKVKLIAADHPARVARAFVQEHVRRGLDMPAVEQGTDDARKFFRRFPNCDPAYMVVAMCNPACMEFKPDNVVHFVLPSFIFGCFSAVYASSRYTAYLTHASRRLLAVPTGGYVDDFSITEPSYARGSGQGCMAELAEYVIDFEDDKHEDMDQLSIFVGVQNDMTYIALRGEMYLGVTTKRRKKLLALLAPYLDLRVGEMLRMTHSQAAKLFEKSRFVLCPVFGRIGVAALGGLQIRAQSVVVQPGTEVHNTTTFLHRAVSELSEPSNFSATDAGTRSGARGADRCVLQGRR